MKNIGLRIALLIINRDAITEQIAGIKTPINWTGNVAHAMIFYLSQVM
jgi:hypothetical protein